MTRHVEDFTLESATGGRFGLSDALADKRAAVVVFWSSVCSHCQRYDDYLNGFAAGHPDVALLAIACREGEEPEALRRAAGERQLRFTILIDADRRLTHAWQVHQTPRAVLLSPQLEILYQGAIDNFTYPEDPKHRPYLETALAEYLAGRPLSRAESPSFGCPVESVYYRMPKPFSR